MESFFFFFPQTYVIWCYLIHMVRSVPSLRPSRSLVLQLVQSGAQRKLCRKADRVLTFIFEASLHVVIRFLCLALHSSVY